MITNDRVYEINYSDNMITILMHLQIQFKDNIWNNLLENTRIREK